MWNKGNKHCYGRKFSENQIPEVTKRWLRLHRARSRINSTKLKPPEAQAFIALRDNLKRRWCWEVRRRLWKVWCTWLPRFESQENWCRSFARVLWRGQGRIYSWHSAAASLVVRRTSRALRMRCHSLNKYRKSRFWGHSETKFEVKMRMKQAGYLWRKRQPLHQLERVIATLRRLVFFWYAFSVHIKRFLCHLCMDA